MSRKPEQRMIDAANQLFYQNGYARTSVQDILDYSQTHKASFYKYFKDKRDIALIYLDQQDKALCDLFEKLAQRCHEPEQFFEQWVKLILRQARSDAFFGCPVVSFAGTIDDDVSLQAKTDHIVKNWTAQLSSIVASWQISETSKSNLEVASKIMNTYQGSAALYRATRNKAYLKNLKANFLEIIG